MYIARYSYFTANIAQVEKKTSIERQYLLRFLLKDAREFLCSEISQNRDIFCLGSVPDMGRGCGGR
jgi:hypothetical protein